VQSTVNPWRLLVKGVLLFLIFEIALYSLAPNPGIINFYAPLDLERERFPISTRDPIDAALDVGNLDAMIASHIVSRPKAPDEFRVLVLGDSAVWGLQLTPNQTLPAQLNALNLTCGNKKVTTYNLSFPRSSSTKDLMILDKVLQYQPDMIIWLITWYTLMPKTRVDHVLVTQNPDEFYKLGRRFDFLPKDYQRMSILDEILNQQRAMFRVARYELYPMIQLATGIDQIPGPPEILPAGLTSDTTFEGLKPPTLRKSQVSLDQVQDFYQLAGTTPVLLINEPMLIVSGVPNSDVRYNSYYPRWVYDLYRQYLNEAALQNGWDYLDLWNMFPPSYFADTPLHLTPDGEWQLAKALAPSIQKICQ
jgi:lysophospholipase L1-like esterase